MFDVEVGGHVYRESEAEEPGEGTGDAATSKAGRVGLTVCYDLRFPELYRILAVEGAELVTVPAAFTLFTGKDHWELLLRARAVENQCYVAAANQWGTYADGKAAYGRSLDRRPLGRRARAGGGRGHASSRAELDRGRTWSASAGACPRSPTASPPPTAWPAEV